MKLDLGTIAVLKNIQSIHKRKGFHTEEQILAFWRKYGAKGFLNIKEVTPKMVQEIRTNIIQKKKVGSH